jgi:hypothetical protein
MRDALIALGLVVGTFLLLVLQEFIPPMGFLSDARVNLIPVLFCYGAMILPFPLMLVLAVAIGLMSDLATLQVVGGSAEIGLGWSVLFYLFVGLICQGLRPLVLRGHWELHTLMSASAAISLPALQFAMITFRRMEAGGIFYSSDVTWKILGPGIITLFVAPVFWFAVTWVVGRSSGFQRMREIER